MQPPLAFTVLQTFPLQYTHTVLCRLYVGIYTYIHTHTLRPVHIRVFLIPLYKSNIHNLFEATQKQNDLSTNLQKNLFSEHNQTVPQSAYITLLLESQEVQ